MGKGGGDFGGGRGQQDIWNGGVVEENGREGGGIQFMPVFSR